MNLRTPVYSINFSRPFVCTDISFSNFSAALREFCEKDIPEKRRSEFKDLDVCQIGYFYQGNFVHLPKSRRPSWKLKEFYPEETSDVQD